MVKKKLTISEQVIHMKDVNGIKFNIVDESGAELFLSNNNYYFKLKSYAKNYEKFIRGANTGKYFGLEFAYLQELSTLDMHLRKLIIRMTLDIEHFLKIQLLKDFSENQKEDGYSFVIDFLNAYKNVSDDIKRKETSSVCGDLISKYKTCFAIWNIVEVISFGDFIKLYEMYYKKYPSQHSMVNNLWPVKFLRNAAAHNSCLLNSLRKPYSRRISPNKAVNTYVSRINGISHKSRLKHMGNPIVHDFVVMLYVFDHVIVSSQIKKNTFSELKDLLDNRFTRNKNYFERNDLIKAYFRFVKIIVDDFYVKCV